MSTLMAVPLDTSDVSLPVEGVLGLVVDLCVARESRKLWRGCACACAADLDRAAWWWRRCARLPGLANRCAGHHVDTNSGQILPASAITFAWLVEDGHLSHTGRLLAEKTAYSVKNTCFVIAPNQGTSVPSFTIVDDGDSR